MTWRINVYGRGKEMETIRGVTPVQKTAVMQVFEREGVSAQAIKYAEDSSLIVDHETVNADPDATADTDETDRGLSHNGPKGMTELLFKRETDTVGPKNVYKFIGPGGTEINLSPDATVSELQNHL